MNPIDQDLFGLAIGVTTPLTVTVSAGYCYLPVTSRIYSEATLTATLASAVSGTMYHIYIYNSASGPAIEVATTAPSDGYLGPARTKSGDTTRRWVGAVYAYAANQIMPLLHSNPGTMSNRVDFMLPSGSSSNSLLAINVGTASSPTSVSFSGILPPGSRVLRAMISNNSSSTAYMGGALTGTLSSSNYNWAIPANNAVQLDLITSSTQTLSYMMGGVITLGGLSLLINGYDFNR